MIGFSFLLNYIIQKQQQCLHWGRARRFGSGFNLPEGCVALSQGLDSAGRTLTCFTLLPLPPSQRCSDMGGPHLVASPSPGATCSQINIAKEAWHSPTKQPSPALPTLPAPCPNLVFIPSPAPAALAVRAGRPLPSPPIAQQLLCVPLEISLFS